MGEPLDIAIRALARRELSTAEMDARLQRAGVPAQQREATLALLRDEGYLSDARTAFERARVLAERERSDAEIRADLARRGIDEELIDDALAAIPSENVRARRLARRIGPSSRLAHTLARRGFSAPAVEEIAGVPIAEEP